MKRIISVLMALCVLLSVMSLAACGKAASESIDGTYQLVQMESGGSDITGLLENVDVVLTVEGNKATVVMNDETVNWQVDLQGKQMINDDGQKVPYRAEGNQLIVEDAENTQGKMVFEKQE